MKLVITGDKGQLGTELKRVLAKGRSELGPIPTELGNAEVIGIDLDELDITDIKAVNSFVTDSRPDVILNCAAYTNVDNCETDADTAMKANAIGPRNLAIAAAEINAKLIHISTDYVFPGDTPTPRNEWDIPNPQSVYGYTKLLGEQYVRQFCARSFIVRTAWLYGYHGGNFVKTILKVARETGKLTVVNDQRGNPTNAADLAHHLLKLAATDEYGVYHCTNNGECSWYEFAETFLSLSGLTYTLEPCTTTEYPRPAKRPAHSSLENRMLRITVGDEMRPWQDAVTAYMRHYNKKTGEITALTF
jgi:dTDP-4-dehydrorhamnose reductase